MWWCMQRVSMRRPDQRGHFRVGRRCSFGRAELLRQSQCLSNRVQEAVGVQYTHLAVPEEKSQKCREIRRRDVWMLGDGDSRGMLRWSIWAAVAVRCM